MQTSGILSPAGLIRFLKKRLAAAAAMTPKIERSEIVGVFYFYTIFMVDVMILVNHAQLFVLLQQAFGNFHYTYCLIELGMAGMLYNVCYTLRLSS